MCSKRNRAIAAIVTTTLLALPLAPASAMPWEPVSPAQAEGSLLTQFWQWLGGLLGTGESSAVSTCSASTAGGGRGCAIDPNGSV